MSKTWIVAMLGCTLALAACGGGSTSSSTKTPSLTTPTATQAPAPTATSVPVAVPVLPSSFSDYAPVIAQYLTADPAASATCLAALFAAWKMPQISPADGCRLANTDEDPANEVVTVLTSPNGTAGAQFEIIVFNLGPGGYKVGYQSDPTDVAPSETTLPINAVLAAGDLNNDGGGEFAFATGICGASTCSTTVHILKGTADGYVSIGGPNDITMASAQAKFQAAGDGTQELLLSGGAEGSVGAGPQRSRTETWAWNGSVYALSSTALDKATYLYHAVKDADTLLAAGSYAEAQTAYVALVGNTALQIWNEQKNERNELESYSLFRAGLAVLLAGGDPTAASGYFARARSYQPQTLHDQLAGSFKAAYDAKGSIRVACSAVRDDIDANLAEYQAFWDFGYSNPPFDSAAICPF